MEGTRSAQLQHQIRQFVTDLATATEGAKSSASILAYLKTAAQFHDYSLNNTLLIYMQKPDATRVMGFHGWRKLGRFVKKGERGIAILAPVTFKVNRDNHREVPAGEEEPEIVTRFRTVFVFDISQTEGLALPEPPVLTGAECSDDLALALTLFADAQGITVRSEKMTGSAMGVSRGGTIVIDETLDGADRFAVLVHETAHEMLNHRGRRDELDKKAREIEAESIAYTVCQHFGVDCTAPAYLALHGADAKDVTARLESIVGTIQAIINGIEDNLTVINTNVVNN